MQKFWGQELNLSHSGDNAESLTAPSRELTKDLNRNHKVHGEFRVYDFFTNKKCT